MNNGILLLVLFFPVPNPLIPLISPHSYAHQEVWTVYQNPKYKAVISPLSCCVLQYMGQSVG